MKRPCATRPSTAASCEGLGFWLLPLGFSLSPFGFDLGLPNYFLRLARSHGLKPKAKPKANSQQPTGIKGEPDLRGEPAASGAAGTICERCPVAVWSEATEPKDQLPWRGPRAAEPRASGADGSRPKRNSVAVWSGATGIKKNPLPWARGKKSNRVAF